jgi:hypothetical protein
MRRSVLAVRVASEAPTAQQVLVQAAELALAVLTGAAATLQLAG